MMEDTSILQVTRSFPQEIALDQVEENIISSNHKLPQVYVCNPSPMTAEEQQSALRQSPDDSAVKYDKQLGFYYLTIGYISDELDAIFGIGNWGYEITYINKFRSPVKSARGEDYYTYYIEGYLIVRWANGEVWRVDGSGQGQYRPNNLRANLSATRQIAISELIKTSAKRIGKRLGKGFTEEIAQELLDSAEDDKDFQDVRDSVGNRLYYNKEAKKDQVIDEAQLEAIVQQYTGTTYDKLSGKALRNVASILRDFPTLNEKFLLVEEARRLELDVSMSMPYSEINRLVEGNRKEKIRSAGL